jgi:hypothetical protein
MSGVTVIAVEPRSTLKVKYFTQITITRQSNWQSISIFQTYGWTTVGSFVPTEKEHRESNDFPFLKLSKGASKSVGRERP